MQTLAARGAPALGVARASAFVRPAGIRALKPAARSLASPGRKQVRGVAERGVGVARASSGQLGFPDGQRSSREGLLRYLKGANGY